MADSREPDPQSDKVEGERAEIKRDQLEAALAQAQSARRRLEDFARATSDWFWETDADGRLTYVSDRITAILGIPGPHLVGRHLTDVGTILPDEEGTVALNDAMKRRRPFRDQILEIEDGEGAVSTHHIAGVPLFDGSGTFSGYRGAGIDMSARYKAERESREARQALENTLEELTNKKVEADLATAQAEAALKSKSEFIASLSHELRTPLNAIIGFADSMDMQVFGELNEQYQQYSKDIAAAARHLLDMINDILDQAAVDAGKLHFHAEPVAVSALIEGALTFVRLRAENKRIEIDVPKVRSDLMVEVDPKRARQILVNLLSNAVKFTPEGGKVGIEVGKARDKMVPVTVWDSGIGIPAKQRDSVFERYQQISDDSYARQQEGSGLGLNISRDLARMMGGDITLESEFGQGSRFTVSFPKTAKKG